MTTFLVLVACNLTVGALGFACGIGFERSRARQAIVERELHDLAFAPHEPLTPEQAARLEGGC